MVIFQTIAISILTVINLIGVINDPEITLGILSVYIVEVSLILNIKGKK